MTTLSRSEANLRAALHLAFSHDATRDLAGLRDVEHLLDRCVAEEVLAHGRCQEARHGGFHVIHEIVDDAVVADLDALSVSGLLRLRIRADVEADDDSLRCSSERDVGFGDATDAGVHDPRLDLVGPELLQSTRNGFDRALNVTLDQKGEILLARSILQRLHHLFERARRTAQSPSSRDAF